MFPAVAALALALAPPPAVQLARLAELYRAYELPLPPKDAKLYRWNRTGWAGHSGFGVRPNADGWPDELLVGCWERSAYFKETVEIQLDPTTIKPGELSLLTVVQLQMIGRHELAETVYAAGGYWKVSSPAEALAARAFDYWEGQLLNPAVDRAKIARRIALVLNGQTKAFGQERYNWPPQTRVRREFYDALVLSLKPTGAKPGSVEAAIDEMLDANLRGGWMECGDPRYYAVAARGFDAVPALLAHLTDARPTRYQTDGGGGFGSPRHCRIKHLASDILEGLMDGDFPRDEEREAKKDKNVDDDVPHDGEEVVNKDKDGVVRAKDVKRWWAKAEKEGEEAYAMRRVLGRDDDTSRPNKYLLKVIQHKYPHRLTELFYIVLADRPEMELYRLAEAVAESTLPKEKKRELFAAAADSKDAGWRQDGRRFLRDVDPDEYRKRMLAAIAALPAIPSDKDTALGSWSYEELIPCDDPNVWAAAEKYLKGADVGRRVEWLWRIGRHDVTADTRPRRVALLAAFLTDDAVRELKAKPDQWADPPDFPKVEVRNVAARALGQLLDLKAKPKADWTANDWTAFRERVATAAKMDK